MISENLSHDSKVWVKEYDLNDKLIKMEGNDNYDNLEDYKYVDIKYDTYSWRVDGHSFQIMKKQLCLLFWKSYWLLEKLQEN